MRLRRWTEWLWVVMGWLGLGVAEAQTLFLRPPGDGAPPRLAIPAASNSVVVFQASADLLRWEELLRAQGPVQEAPDLRQPAPGRAYYRAQIRPRNGTDDGKHLLVYPGDGFQSEDPQPWLRQARWVKFALLLSEPHRAWFQDSARYPFHYEFARARLPDFAGLTRAQFDAVTLRREGQQAVLGAVLFPPGGQWPELAIQFVGLEPYPAEQVARWFETVRALIQRPAGTEVVYFPTFEQAEVARQNLEWFAARGIRVGSASRWVSGDECYSGGWTLGRLVFAAGKEIGDAYRTGDLRPEDVLLTDAVPAEVPPVAGIVTLTAATPNSHVAILAQSFGIPFVYPADAARQEAIQGWVGREVVVRAEEQFDGCRVLIEAVAEEVPAPMREAIQTLKVPPDLELPVKRVAGILTLPADGLRPRDADRVGGKAANFGLLRRSLPDASPQPALALTFDLWDGYLDQVLPGGQTLRETIEERLGGFTWPPDMAALSATLEALRELITDTADFDAPQRQAILEALQAAGLDPGSKIRFRSSTNVEDSQSFSGAGLYDSYSGCLADELDGDDTGPSGCDAEEGRERGVFRAIRKVFASFYNDNAYLERLRHRVREAEVGMAVLVHPSTPDEVELANGVATFRVRRGGGRFVSGELVTQAGAVSVANPDATAVPETVSVMFFSGGPALTVEQHSSLVPLGATVMDWERDYRELAELLDTAARAYEAEFPGRSEYHLDFEYKKVGPDGRLQVKQIREVPAAPERTHTPWLVSTESAFTVAQGEFGDPIAFHRLKSEWMMRSRNTSLGDEGLGSSLYRNLRAKWRLGAGWGEVDSPPESLSEYAFEVGADAVHDRWVVGEGEIQRRMELRTPRLGARTEREGPLVTLADLRLELRVRYATPQPTLQYDPAAGGFVSGTTSEETVFLTPVLPVTAESLRQERVIKRGTVTVTTAYWWPAPPSGPTAGYTAPLQAWDQTTITGLTSRPLVLRSPWAQTYHPGHHNFFEEFLFEPGLDPGVDEDQRAELEAANIRAIVLGGAPGQPADYGFIWGLDDQIRKW